MYSTNEAIKETNYFTLAKKEFDELPIMRSPWPIIVIIVSYIIFVTKFGPSLMKNRKPMNINGIMLVYNLYQCVSNGYMFMQIFVVKGALKFSIDHACHPLERNRNPYWHVVAHSTHLFILSKIMDLFDTVFFILKKKQTHVTFLHVYHHVNMVISSWVVCKYFPDEQFFVAGLLNSFVHCVMYGYYFLAALGPRVRKYLWWKIYVTRLQMIQFVLIAVHVGWLILNKCHIPDYVSVFLLIQTMTFLFLFINFYVRNYIKPKDVNKISSKHANYRN